MTAWLSSPTSDSRSPLLTERANLTQHGEILGTPHYLAPEIIRGKRRPLRLISTVSAP